MAGVDQQAVVEIQAFVCPKYPKTVFLEAFKIIGLIQNQTQPAGFPGIPLAKNLCTG